MRPRTLAVVVALAVMASGLCGCAGDQQMQTRIKQMARQQLATEDYQVAPPDELTIEVRGEPELSRTVIVRPDGKVTVPTVGDMYVQGKTIPEIDAEMTEALSKELAAPNVTVTLVAARSKAIYVLGEVRRAGMQPYFGDMTLIDAIGAAGGLTLYANAGAVKVTRPAMDNPDVYNVNIRYLVYKGEAAYNLCSRKATLFTCRRRDSPRSAMRWTNCCSRSARRSGAS